MTAPIELSEYNPQWPTMFSVEKLFLKSVAGKWLYGDIEHVGSTSVPGLIAKPVIDIMFGVKSLKESEPAIPALEQAGYCYAPYKTDVMHWFCKPSEHFRTHHLHLAPFESPLWFERIMFRDLLRKDAGLATEYALLKQQLADRHCDDRQAYTDAKWPFIFNALAQKGRLQYR